MANNNYYKNNNNRNRNNGGYNNNYNRNRNFNNTYAPFNAGRTIDGRKHKSEDFNIIDLNGVTYRINGNIATELQVMLVDNIERLNKIKTANTSDITVLPELVSLMKETCLCLINHNVDGVEYTMADVNRGFSDIVFLMEVIVFAYHVSEEYQKNFNKRLSDVGYDTTGNKQ